MARRDLGFPLLGDETPLRATLESLLKPFFQVDRLWKREHSKKVGFIFVQYFILHLTFAISHHHTIIIITKF